MIIISQDKKKLRVMDVKSVDITDNSIKAMMRKRYSNYEEAVITPASKFYVEVNGEVMAIYSTEKQATKVVEEILTALSLSILITYSTGYGCGRMHMSKSVDTTKLGPQVFDREAKDQRITAAEYMIRSLPHFNNQVRLLADEFQLIKEKVAKAKVEGDPTNQLNEKLRKVAEDQMLYSNMADKVDDFLFGLDEGDMEILINLFIKNKTYKNVALNHKIDDSTLHRRVKRILNKF